MFLDGLTTPHLADACLRLKLPVIAAPFGMVGIRQGMRCEGPALPVRHGGSVDVFMEAFQSAQSGAVLVVDNQNRRDEGCIGDLVALEAKNAGLAGIVIWGAHRDSVDLREIGLPVFSFGAYAPGPERADSTEGVVMVGEHRITNEHYVLADDDGILFLDSARLTELVEAAHSIRTREKQIAEQMRQGISFREQVAFDEYQNRRKGDSDYTFRKHLRYVNGAIEE